MSKLSTVIAFFTGAAIGGATVWYITKERYAQLAEEEISSVKEAYAQRESKERKPKRLCGSIRARKTRMRLLRTAP